MNRAPAFQFYPEKWDAHTKHLSDAAHRIYHGILCWMWMHSPSYCSCTDDPAKISRLLVRQQADIESALLEIQDSEFPLLKHSGGRYYSEGLRKEAERQVRWREKSSSGGVKSGKSRNSKALEAKGASFSNEPNTKPPTPTPTPSPDSEEREREGGWRFEFWQALIQTSKMPSMTYDLLATLVRGAPGAEAWWPEVVQAAASMTGTIGSPRPWLVRNLREIQLEHEANKKQTEKKTTTASGVPYR